MRAELVWYRTSDAMRLSVVRRVWPGIKPETVRVSNLRVPARQGLPPNAVVLYRHPVELVTSPSGPACAPVFAVLAGSSKRPFRGCKAEIAELLLYARRHRRLLYVIPAGQVTDEAVWTGYVRADGRWLALPVPRPQAVYNRIPFRNVERSAVSQRAKQRLAQLGIPLFNLGYFNKATLYEWLQASPCAGNLPETVTSLRRDALLRLLVRHRAVYLKPAGGSIGQGIIRLRRVPTGFEVAALRNGRAVRETSPTLAEAWRRALALRAPGRYVMQAAVHSICWDGRPCDFRVLLQKRLGAWRVTGIGVRVAGPDSITTHVPNGGTIERLDRVLDAVFGAEANHVRDRLEQTALKLAEVIDGHYDRQLGEMSMDLALDDAARVWFLEANAKPMKFDEPDIRERSLAGVLAYLEELATRTL